MLTISSPCAPESQPFPPGERGTFAIAEPSMWGMVVWQWARYGGEINLG
ncbi:hypothetical protein SAMN04489731_12312 [Amycolatopsis regifaucium]|nr:hypothetical protein SAMN04489731_12312 [Amycolatopsis regifaucium]